MQIDVVATLTHSVQPPLAIDFDVDSKLGQSMMSLSDMKANENGLY